MNNMDKRSALAVALSFGGLMLWWGFISKKQQPLKMPDQQEQEFETQKNAPTDIKTPVTKKLNATTGDAVLSENISEDTLTISSKQIRCQIGRDTGRIRHLFLKEKNHTYPHSDNILFA